MGGCYRQAAFCGLLVPARKKARLAQQQLAGHSRNRSHSSPKFEGGERRLDVVGFCVSQSHLGIPVVAQNSEMTRKPSDIRATAILSWA